MGPRTRSVCAERRGRRCDQGMRMMQGSDSKVYYFVPDIPPTAGCARQAESEVRQGPLGVRERQTCRDAEAMGRCSWLATGALAAAAGCCCWLLGVPAGSARRACCVPALRSRARRLAVRWGCCPGPWPHLAQAITGGRLSSKLYGCHRPCHRPRHQHSPQTEWWAIRVAGQSITSYLGIFGGRHRQILPGSCQVPASSPRSWPV